MTRTVPPVVFVRMTAAILALVIGTLQLARAKEPALTG